MKIKLFLTHHWLSPVHIFLNWPSFCKIIIFQRTDKKSDIMRKGGGLYGNFVSASDNVQNKAYRGAEIPPPDCLNSGAGRGRGPGPGPGGSGPVIGGFGGGSADKGGGCDK